MPRNIASDSEVVQRHNLCNTCQKLWEDCGMLQVRETRIVRFHPRSAGYTVTTKCPGFVYWPERVAALYLPIATI